MTLVTDSSASEFPTLLHLAANFGLHEFASKLIDYPNAQFAYAVKNAAGKIPETVAMDNSYKELALLFQDFRVIVITIFCFVNRAYCLLFSLSLSKTRPTLHFEWDVSS